MSNRKKRSNIWLTPKDELIPIVKKSSSLSEILRNIGMRPTGSNSRTLRTRLNEECFDLTHISLGKNSNKGRKFKVAKCPLSEILIVDSSYCRGSLKKRLLEEGIFKMECSKCGQTAVWNGMPLIMVIDHCNGIHNDNRLENLRMLCPNCNSQTSTFAGRNLKHRTIKINCVDCGKEINKQCTRCKSCATKATGLISRKINWPPLDELLADIQKTNRLQVSKKLGVSETAIRKMLKRGNLDVKNNIVDESPSGMASDSESEIM